jgi:hypothetical protein
MTNALGRPFQLRNSGFVGAIISTFMLGTYFVGQERGGAPPGDGYVLIGSVLSKAHASGSLEYWGVCNFKEFYPDFPKLRAVPDHEGSAVELLRERFSEDPEMRVSQDRDGKIRMVETDVPTDLLDVKIHHVRWLAGYHGPNMAVTAIVTAPEVIAFRREHNLGPKEEWATSFPVSGDALSFKPSVSGDLEDVTVREALDYVLETFQGFWLYENCKSPEGGRIVHFGFVENVPNPPSVQERR